MYIMLLQTLVMFRGDNWLIFCCDKNLKNCFCTSDTFASDRGLWIFAWLHSVEFYRSTPLFNDLSIISILWGYQKSDIANSIFSVSSYLIKLKNCVYVRRINKTRTQCFLIYHHAISVSLSQCLRSVQCWSFGHVWMARQLSTQIAWITLWNH